METLNSTFRDHVESIVARIECKPYELYVAEVEGIVCVQARLFREDVDTGLIGYGYSALYMLEDSLSTDAIVRRCFAACLAYAEHETRENFKWEGRRVLGPHVSLKKLWEACDA